MISIQRGSKVKLPMETYGQNDKITKYECDSEIVGEINGVIMVYGGKVLITNNVGTVVDHYDLGTKCLVSFHDYQGTDMILGWCAKDLEIIELPITLSLPEWQNEISEEEADEIEKKFFS